MVFLNFTVKLLTPLQASHGYTFSKAVNLNYEKVKLPFNLKCVFDTPDDVYIFHRET